MGYLSLEGNIPVAGKEIAAEMRCGGGFLVVDSFTIQTRVHPTSYFKPVRLFRMVYSEGTHRGTPTHVADGGCSVKIPFKQKTKRNPTIVL